jgi:hypothetical protein
MAIINPPLPDRIEKVFAPHAREVGKLVASWNQLQERLDELFSVIVRKDHPGIALAIWYSTRSDLAQRQMLRASSEAAAAAGLFPEQAKKEDIKWLLDRTNELAQQRNDAIHAPVAFFTDQDGTRSWYEKKASALSGFALRCAASLGNADIGWPERPKLPNRGE